MLSEMVFKEGEWKRGWGWAVDRIERRLQLSKQSLKLYDTHMGACYIILFVHIFEIFRSKFKKQTYINIEGKTLPSEFSKNLCRRASITDTSCFFFSLFCGPYNTTYFQNNKNKHSKEIKLDYILGKQQCLSKFGREHIVKDVNSWASIPRNSYF